MSTTYIFTRLRARAPGAAEQFGGAEASRPRFAGWGRRVRARGDRRGERRRGDAHEHRADDAVAYDGHFGLGTGGREGAASARVAGADGPLVATYARPSSPCSPRSPSTATP